MTDNEIIEALAKLDGWEKRLHGMWSKTPHLLDICNDLPPYLTSYDAIIPLILKQRDGMRRDTLEALLDMRENCDIVAAFDATPRDLCVALLKAKGLYHD